jgi:integrase
MSEQEQEPKAQKRQQQQKQSQKRGWGEGQIIPRGSDPNKPDRYLVRIPLPPGPDGKRQYHNKTIKGSKTKAREYLATELAKIHGARDLRRILKAAGLPYTDPKTGVRGLRLYDLRHSCATLLLAEGKHAKVVADRLGHTSVAMTLDVYSHVTRRLEDEVAESFDRKFNKPNEKRRSDS